MPWSRLLHVMCTLVEKLLNNLKNNKAKMTAVFRLASAGDDIKLWDCDGFILEKQFNPHVSNISSVCWSHDNSVLTSASTAGDKVVMTYPDKSAFTYTVAEKENVTCVSFNTTSRYVMGGTPAGVVHIWDLKSKTLKKTYQDHKGAITALQFNWNDSVISSGSESGEILLYNVVSGVASSPLVGAKAQAVRKLQYSHFKKSLLGSCSDSGGVFLWDANKRQLLNSFTTSHMAPATCIAFSPLNEMLLMSVGLDKRIVCYDVQGKSAVQTMLAESPLTSVDLMHDGVTLAVGSTRGKVYIFDLRKGAEPMRTIIAHKSSVQGLCFQYKAGKSSDSSRGKPLPVASRKSHNSINTNNNTLKDPASPNALNGLSRSTEFDGPLNTGEEERNKLLHTSPANLQPHSVQPHDELYSPIRERLSFNRSNNNSLLKFATTPKTPVLDGSGDLMASHGGKNSSINNYADGMFSPVAEKSVESSSSPPMDARKQPMGSQANSYSRYNSTQPAPPRVNLTAEHDLPLDQKYGTVSAFPANDHRTSHSPPSRLSHESPESRTGVRPQPPASSVSPAYRGGRRSSPQSGPEQVITPPEARPSDHPPEGAAAQPYPMATTACEPSRGATPSIQPFHTEFIRNMIDDALEEFKDQIRQDVLNLHMEMLKQFRTQQEEMRAMFQQFSLNDQLIAEIERLKDENRKLKKTF